MIRRVLVRTPRAVASLLLVIGTVLAGGWLEEARAGHSDAHDGTGFDRPFLVHGDEGATVDARTIDVTVLGLRGAGVAETYGKPLRTSGVWLAVKVRVVAHDKAAGIGFARLRDGRDRLFTPSGRLDQPMTSYGVSQPGLPMEGEVGFEVPADLTGPLSLELAEPSIDRRMDAVAEVDLPDVPADRLDAWRASTEPITLERPS